MLGLDSLRCADVLSFLVLSLRLSQSLEVVFPLVEFVICFEQLNPIESLFRCKPTFKKHVNGLHNHFMTEIVFLKTHKFDTSVLKFILDLLQFIDIVPVALVLRLNVEIFLRLYAIDLIIVGLWQPMLFNHTVDVLVGFFVFLVIFTLDLFQKISKKLRIKVLMTLLEQKVFEGVLLILLTGFVEVIHVKLTNK